MQLEKHKRNISAQLLFSSHHQPSPAFIILVVIVASSVIVSQSCSAASSPAFSAGAPALAPSVADSGEVCAGLLDAMGSVA